MILAEIAQSIGGTLVGDPDCQIGGVASLAECKATDLSFILESAYVEEALQARAAAFVTFEKLEGFSNQIVVRHPRQALAKVIQLFQPQVEPQYEISEKAHLEKNVSIGANVLVGPFSVIGEGSEVGENTKIFANVTIGKNCKIGKNCTLYPGSVVYDRCVLGDRVIVHSGAVVGSDGFGYYPDQNRWIKIPHIGRTVIGDDVELGGNCVVSRGCLGDTVVGKGTKIDNLVHVAHNCKIGEDCFIAGQVGMVGGFEMGDRVQVAGQVGFNRVKVGNDVRVGGKSGVTKSIPSGLTVSGYPAQNHRDEMLYQATLKKIAKEHHARSKHQIT